jgi:glycosyltransferase involved in cell wall biosynthesis
MKKLLVYATLEDLKPIGGPSGTLHNLIDLFQSSKSIEIIDFLKTKKIIPDQSDSFFKINRALKMIINPFLFLNQYFPLLTYFELVLFRGDNRISPYELVHFHSTFDMFKNRRLLTNKTVILQSHSPIPSHHEFFDGKNFKIYRRIIQFFFRVCDKYSFSRADKIIFPVVEAMDGYRKFPFLKSILETSSDKILFVRTGILDPLPQNIYANNESSNTITFGFLGRHIEVKGYDTFVDVFSQIIDKNNGKVLVGGRPNKKIHFPQSSNWKELGFIDKVEFFRLIDIIVVPNRETYFDLVVLEALAMGKVIVLSLTGGNKHFLKYKELINDSIFFYEYEEELYTIASSLCQIDSNTIKIRGLKNRELYLKFFTARRMYESYMEIVNCILNENKSNHL